jgi:hypothetical protein
VNRELGTVGYLKDISDQRVSKRGKTVTLDNPGHLMIFAKVDQLLLSSQGRRPMRWVPLSTESDISEVQA